MTYKLPHALDRAGQAEALQWILESDKKYLILCAPTGFGKSPLAAATSIDYKTMALVLHKSLQSANYKEQYDFDILYGKSNYLCLKKPSKQLQMALEAAYVPKLTAYDCDDPDCNCPYQSQERLCMSSMRTSLNYAKFLMSRPFIDNCYLDYLYLDEAHNLPEIVTSFVGVTIEWDNEFIQCNGGLKPGYLIGNDDSVRLNYNEAMALFRACARAIEKNNPGRDEDLRGWRKWKRLYQKIQITNNILARGSLEDWYYEANQKSLVIKPLTAKYHFKHLFDVAEKVVLMSATITPNIAERLGLEPDEFDYYNVPNPWPTPTRLVYDLGGPAMNYRSSEADKHRQAEIIASVLRPDKSGVIHVASKRQAYELADRLDTLLGNVFDQADYKIFIPPEGKGTDEQLQAWYNYRQPGTYCIAWAFQEGVDLGDDDIIIIAKVPYPPIGKGYGEAKKEYDINWWLQLVAYIFQQACGRNRRGKPEHYINGNRLVYIADSAYHRLKTLFSNEFRNAIRKKV